MNLEIVKMDKIHLDKIANELIEFDEFWNSNILIDEFNNENSKYFVLINEENILGFAGLWFNIDEAHIMNIAVKKDFRRNHFGSKLLEFLMDVAQEEKDCITLEVREDNIAAINLYKKMDFIEVGRRKKYYNKIFDAIIMTKNF
ncbi:MAG: ribosomal protein S18-alanine N-acetyltransferase [Clostridia bacterium]|jgi:ribosomal-protein-alanine N-acetyltransferase|nr:ribosomal protein S18-alanine N-acetyltransferase [Clostridia bacterium]